MRGKTKKKGSVRIRGYEVKNNIAGERREGNLLAMVERLPRATVKPCTTLLHSYRAQSSPLAWGTPGTFDSAGLGCTRHI